MTLYRQLIIAVAALFILLFGVSVVVGVYHARELVEQQMQVHAQDTATSVALSMTQAAQEQDMASLDTMFNAVSDSGYFRLMSYRNLDGKVILERDFPVKIEGVPDWFVASISLPSPEGRAEVASGWMRLGELLVISHPGQAYYKLWQVTKEQLIGFAIATVVICLLASLALRLLLQPLARVEAQADAICEKEFKVQTEIPKTRELKRVVQAMNRMAVRLKEIFDHQLALIGRLQEQSLRDPVTGLSNRLDFDNRIRSFVQPESGAVSAALAIVSINEFEHINDRVGREEGNAILKTVGEHLSRVVADHSQAIVARRQGPEFTVFIPNVIEVESRELAQSLFDAVQMIEWQNQDEDPLVWYMGLTHSHEVTDAAELLREADMALKLSSDEGVSNWKSLADTTGLEKAPLLSAPAEEWLQQLESAIAAQEMSLLYQPAYTVTAERKLVGHEVYSRLPNGESAISAGIFMPLAERFGLADQFDRMMLEGLATRVSDFTGEQFICANISVASIESSDFMGWLRDFLVSNQALAKRLVIEVPEHAMHIEEHYIRDLSDLLQANNARLGIDHFGLAASAFGYLGTLPLHHIKIHRSFIHGLESSPENSFYIQSLAQVARSRDIQLMIEGVERDEEWAALAGLGIEAAQGYLLGEPKSDPVDS